MVTNTRAERVSVAFVKLTDTLVADYDVLDLLHTLVEESVGLLDVAAAGLLLADPSGELQVLRPPARRAAWWRSCSFRQEPARASSAT